MYLDSVKATFFKTQGLKVTRESGDGAATPQWAACARELSGSDNLDVKAQVE